MIELHVQAHTFGVPEDTPVAFDAGIDSLMYFRPGQKFYVEVEVVRRTPISEGDTRLLVQPCGIAAVED